MRETRAMFLWMLALSECAYPVLLTTKRIQEYFQDVNNFDDLFNNFCKRGNFIKFSRMIVDLCKVRRINNAAA